MLPKSKIRLSRNLHAQTTPYPEAGRWLRRGMILVTLVLIIGIYFAARPSGHKPAGQSTGQSEPNKQILGEQDESPGYITYEIKKGDTLFNLASRYNVSWKTLSDINALKEPYLLKVGQKIKIPGTQ